MRTILINSGFWHRGGSFSITDGKGRISVDGQTIYFTNVQLVQSDRVRTVIHADTEIISGTGEAPQQLQIIRHG